jgi:hypothetical protein
MILSRLVHVYIRNIPTCMTPNPNGLFRSTSNVSIFRLLSVHHPLSSPQEPDPGLSSIVVLLEDAETIGRPPTLLLETLDSMG